jgi:hypothetical protein
MTNPEKRDDSSRPIQTLSMAEFNSFVTKTNPATAELPPVMLEYLRQFKVDAIRPDEPIRPAKA